ncbi:uncharacterized protein ASCRUDRAFT_142298 [Ascoidea rubescens DSM 1968]|uniref:Uncharacterized protein n=1 Tax=Ascoidea rubescens DSM 1968 TaxID=1344418 RepID=A0A1D2VIK2_9ASCO|nr:hypothetical protein ASCRUDRAFT_142298 [Ascoidea rubescens DSM 1968]ODV61455.1 hypothetical protein ASCRUDRAFT_142298 [Ascoidea rubescens DSM 1968]
MKSYRKSEEIEVNLFKSYNNYGFGLDKFSRIQRFLWWRRFSLFFEGNQERIKKSIEDDEKLMKKLVESSKARNENEENNNNNHNNNNNNNNSNNNNNNINTINNTQPKEKYLHLTNSMS